MAARSGTHPPSGPSSRRGPPRRSLSERPPETEPAVPRSSKESTLPRRTLGLDTITTTPGHNRSGDLGDLTNIAGLDLLHLFRGLFVELDPDELRDERRGRYIHIDEIQTLGRTVLIRAESGPFGEVGRTMNVHTHETQHERTRDDSSMNTTRLALTIPPGADTGVFGVERASNSGAGSDLIAFFRRALLSRFQDHGFQVESVLEPDTWAEGANLLAVRAVAYSYPNDLAKGLTATERPLGQLAHTLEPEKGAKILPTALWKAIREHRIDTAELLGFRGEDVDATFVKLSRNGREKTFNVDRERSPSIRELLTDHGVDPLTDIEFARRCQDSARDFYEQKGLTWDDRWRDGSWSPEAQAIRMPPHRTTAAGS